MPRVWYHCRRLADVNDIVEVGKVIARVETTSKNNQNEKITPSKSLPQQVV